MKSDELKKFILKIKDDKKAIAIILLALVGMMLVLLSDSGGTNEDEKSEVNSQEQLYSERELAENLEKFISNIEGAGKTKVIVTYECFEETIYISDRDEQIRSDGETDISDEHIVIDTGDREDGLKSKVIAPKVRGVAVVCQGGDNPTTKEMIVTAISALLNISSNKISVAPMAD